jgi:hypothetical protein
MDIKFIIEIVSAIAIFGACVVAICQLRLMKRSFIVDHERRRKQATFEFYHSIYKRLIKSLKRIDENLLNDQDIKVHDVEGNKEISDAISEYLSCMERFSIGIDEGIFDFKVFKRTVGATLTIRWYDRLKECIPYFQKKYGDDFAYKDLENLVTNLKAEQMKKILKQDSDK